GKPAANVVPETSRAAAACASPPRSAARAPGRPETPQRARQSAGRAPAQVRNGSDSALGIVDAVTPSPAPGSMHGFGRATIALLPLAGACSHAQPGLPAAAYH